MADIMWILFLGMMLFLLIFGVWTYLDARSSWDVVPPPPPSSITWPPPPPPSPVLPSKIKSSVDPEFSGWVDTAHQAITMTLPDHCNDNPVTITREGNQLKIVIDTRPAIERHEDD